MLSIIQIPLTDIRSFLGADSHKLPFPSWPFARPDAEFVRGFGPIRQRRLGGTQDFTGEELYCDLTRGLRLPAGGNRIPISDGNNALYPYCAFRRLMVDGRFSGRGSLSCRLELGTGYRRKNRWLSLGLEDTIAVVRSLLETKFLWPNGKQTEARLLLHSGHKIAAQYLRATTKTTRSTSTAPEAWWLQPGSPLLLIQYSDGELAELPAVGREVVTMRQPGFMLYHIRLEHKGMRFGAWFFGVKRDIAKPSQVRELRLAVLRLHAERESMKQVLRLLAQKRIKIRRGTVASECLQRYLDESIRLLSKQKRGNIPQSEILDAAQDYQDFITPGEKETLMTELESARKTLLRRLHDFAAPTIGAGGTLIKFTARNVTVINEQNGSKTVINQTIDFGSGNTFTGVNVVAAKSIQDSWNRTASAQTNRDLRDALQELHRAVAKMAEQLSEQKQSNAAKDLETLSSEALSPAPRKEWYELSAKGLIEAAKTVGEIATPVTSAVKAVLGLLG